MAGVGPLAPIKAECQKLNEKWPGQITFKKEGQPFPVGVTRNIPAPPEAAAWDVYDIQVKMVIAGRDPADLAVWVEIPMPSLPSSLTNRWAAELEKKWKTTLKDPRAKGKGWLLSMVFQFAEKRYLDFLKMDPSVVDTYSAADDTGTTTRRYTITKPDDTPIDEEAAAEEAAKVAREEAEAELAWITKKLEQEELDMESKAIEAEQKRAMAEEGMLEHVFKPLSKKEEQARLDAKSKKGKQGVRTAKTGERKHKFDADADAEQKKQKEQDKKDKKNRIAEEKMEGRGQRRGDVDRDVAGY